MTQLQLADLKEALTAMGVFPQAKVAKGDKQTKAQMLSAKDKATVAAFKRRGFTVTLMDRTDPTKAYDVRPFGRWNAETGKFNGWLAEGQVVNKGQKAVNGMFFVEQTHKATKEELEAFKG